MKTPNRRKDRLGAVAAAAAIVVAGCSSSSTEASTEYIVPSTDQCNVVAGKDVTLTVPYSPGGGYDSYARLIAPKLGEKMGSTIVVANEDGAGGLLAINNLQRAKKDGTEIAIMNGIGSGGASLADAPGVNFELDQFSYIGRVAGDAQMLVTKGGGPIKTWKDVQNAQGFRFGSTGAGASDFVTPSLLIAMFDLNAKVLTGFQGSSEVELAMLQGDIDGMSGQLDSRAPALESGDQQAVLTIDRQRPDIAPNTPTLGELDLSPEQRELAETHLRLIDLGRPLVGPPGMDARALSCLRGALAEIVTDPGLVATAEKAGRPLNYRPGEELEKSAKELMTAPESYLKVLRESTSK